MLKVIKQLLYKSLHMFLNQFHWQTDISQHNSVQLIFDGIKATNLCNKSARMYNQLFTATAAHSHLFKFNNKKLFSLSLSPFFYYSWNIFIFSPHSICFNQFSWNFWNKFLKGFPMNNECDWHENDYIWNFHIIFTYIYNNIMLFFHTIDHVKLTSKLDASLTKHRHFNS